MTISEFVRNITEVQSQHFVKHLNQDDYDKLEKILWLVWHKLKLIREIEIFEALSILTEKFTIKEIKDGKFKVRNGFRDLDFFYQQCIEYIPKRKYSFIHPKKIKKRNYDYDFLKYLSKDLNASIANCEEYHDIYEELGILEEEKKKIFIKYGIDTHDEEKPTGEPLKSTCEHRIWLFETESKRIKKLGYKERRKILGESNLREYISKETGISQSQYYKLKYIQENSPDKLELIDSERTTVRNVYRELKGLDTETKIKEREIKQFRKQIELLSKELTKEQMINIIKDI